MNKIKLILIAVTLMAFTLPKEKKIRIFMAGDSTMSHYNTDKTPQRGWGQVFPRFFDQNVEVINKARGGRSTKSFIKEGLWQQLVDSLHKGDWVFIEFGHNDHDRRHPERYTPPEDYKNNLIKMVKDVQAKGAHAILLTPIAMRTFDANGVYHDGHGVYPEKVKEAAKVVNVPVIDLDKDYGQVISKMGPDASKKFFMNFGPGLYQAYPDGHKDNTHQREAGAMEVAKLAAQSIISQHIEPLAKHIVMPK